MFDVSDGVAFIRFVFQFNFRHNVHNVALNSVSQFTVIHLVSFERCKDIFFFSQTFLDLRAV